MEIAEKDILLMVRMRQGPQGNSLAVAEVVQWSEMVLRIPQHQELEAMAQSGSGHGNKEY